MATSDTRMPFGHYKPRILADRLMVFVDKALKELFLNEEVILEEVEIFDDDMDMQNLGHIENRLQAIFHELHNEKLTGDHGLRRIRLEVFEVYQDLTNKLLATKKFPEFTALHEL